MEVRGEPPASASCPPPAQECPGIPVSQELLTAGSGGRGGILDRLLITSKPNCGENSTLQTVRIERSPLLDQVQAFLPQMAQANEKLRREIAAAAPGRFNIEKLDGTVGDVIQMDVALFEMNESNHKGAAGSEEHSQDSAEDSSGSEDEGDSTSSEVTIDNFKLPHSEDAKGKIEVLDTPASIKKK
ncbi:NOP protein chaperone 1 [Erinaceus europaeus]|uniref:NOP protein chaperone 1 n=1 Tax=Erinaceus europaeus TaxID=9365 RepID=A0A1S3ACZ6_ERIEU|nr:NOP protein chaperone 1 [Erinaceus europaeus]